MAIAACPAEADPAKKQQQILYGSVGGGATAIFYPENLFFGIRGETAPFLRLADIETDDGRAVGGTGNVTVGAFIDATPLHADGMRAEMNASWTEADGRTDSTFTDTGPGIRYGWVSLTSGNGFGTLNGSTLVVETEQEFSIQKIDALAALDYQNVAGGMATVLFGPAYIRQRQETNIRASITTSMTLDETLKTDYVGAKFGAAYARDFVNGIFANLRVTGSVLRMETYYSGYYSDSTGRNELARLRKTATAFASEMRGEIGYRVLSNVSLGLYAEGEYISKVPSMQYRTVNTDPVQQPLAIGKDSFTAGTVGLRLTANF